MKVEITGIPAAPGVAIGPAWRYGADRQVAHPVPSIQLAAEQASAELTALADGLRAGGRGDEASILEAQALMALDPMLVDEAEAIARRSGRSDPEGLAHAVETASRVAAEGLDRLTDELLASRSSDVRDVGARISRIIRGRTPSTPDEPSILVAGDLPPSIAVEFPAGSIAGIALEGGSVLSHAAILARELGIPAVVGAAGLLAAIDAADAGVLALDGGHGRILVDPDRDELASLLAQGESMAEPDRPTGADA